MIEVKYGELSKKSLQRYCKFLINKVYKILPMKEEKCDTLKQYLESLQVELIGNSQLLEFLVDEPQFISLLNIIQYLISDNYDNKVCKREVFKAINLIEEVNKKYFKEV